PRRPPGSTHTSSNRSNWPRSLTHSNGSDSRLANRGLSKIAAGPPKPVAHHSGTLIAERVAFITYLGEDQVHANVREQARPSGTSDLSDMRPPDPSKRRYRALGRLHASRGLRVSATSPALLPRSPVIRTHRSHHHVTGVTPAVVVKSMARRVTCDGPMELNEGGP